MNYVYILKCSDGTFYTGYTNDLEKRISVHNKGKGAKYTRGRLPVKLIYFEEYDSKNEALHREFAIKKMTRQNKLNLIKNCQQL
ncbi:GIY-YIG nuclease family protein [Clostridium ljungdahlii]|uniref:GIY-YIG nuclease superfamily protein n=1 Tax=Clostridium ljungdahlii TaxID=1538 RepID=A0A168NMX9_9CLOT|nr:GIY-YIG nuclease family protein [Clostridium ljungdahlii]OAA86665.1 GIY-YIG nuclease superfamily protein [Clostridium ljungdahlii]